MISCTLYLHFMPNYSGRLQYWLLLLGNICPVTLLQQSCHSVTVRCNADYVHSNQLEKLEAAKAACLVCLCLLSLTGAFWVLLGPSALVLLNPSGSFWVLLGTYIMYKRNMAILNRRKEVYTVCRHRLKTLLSKS